MIQKTELKNGVVVISETLPYFNSVSVGIWLDAGSRDEDPLVENGIAHAYEHMVFKGTQNFTALDLVQKIEGRGGHLNAYTTREETCFYVRVIPEELPQALNILTEMVSVPDLDIKEFKKEKNVILEEVRSTLDAPDEWVHDLFAEVLWGKSGLGMPIAGTLKTVKSLNADMLKSWQERVNNHYRVVVSAVGAVVHEELVEQINKLMISQVGFTPKRPRPIGDVSSSPRFKVLNRDVQQSNVVWGTQIQGLDLREKRVLAVLSAVLGDGMSSRLFQEVREKYGLVYSVYSAVDHFDGSDSISVIFATEAKKTQKAQQAVRESLLNLYQNGLREGELENALRMCAGNILLSSESTSNRMSRLGRQVLRDYPIERPREIADQIMSITGTEVMEMFARVLAQPWCGAAILPKGLKWKSDIEFRGVLENI